MKKPANNSAPAPEGDGTVDLHEEYSSSLACGLEHDRELPSDAMQNIALRLRGIVAITAVLMAELEVVSLGEFLRGGLVEAAHALAWDADVYLHDAYERAGDAQGAAA